MRVLGRTHAILKEYSIAYPRWIGDRVTIESMRGPGGLCRMKGYAVRFAHGLAALSIDVPAPAK